MSKYSVSSHFFNRTGRNFFSNSTTYYTNRANQSLRFRRGQLVRAKKCSFPDTNKYTPLIDVNETILRDDFTM